MRPAPRRGLRTGGAAVGAGRGARQPRHRRGLHRGLPRLPDRHQTQGCRRRSRVHGPAGPGTGDGRTHRVLRAQPRRVQVHRHPGQQDGGRHPARRQPQGGLPDPGLRQGAAPAGGADLADVRSGRPRRGTGRGRARRRRAGLQLQRRQQKIPRGHGQRRVQHRGRSHGRHPGRQRLRFLQAAGEAGGGMGRRRRRGGGPRRQLLRARAFRWTRRH